VSKKLLFFLCNIVALSYASDRLSSHPVSFLDMCTVGNERAENQDRRSFCRLPNKGLFFGVLDGHGTDQVAEHVSRTLPNSFSRHLNSLPSEQEAFNKAFKEAENYALNDLNGGSTALFVYIKDDIAHVAHVGDSRAVFGNKKIVAFATQDHKPDRQDEYDRIVQANGITYRERRGSLVGPSRINSLAMSRSIGDRWCKGLVKGHDLHLPREKIELVGHGAAHRTAGILTVVPGIGQVIADPEYTRVPLEERHRWLVIASDGLWDKVTNEEALAIVQEYYDAHESIGGISEVLCDYAIDNGSKDNVTVLVIDLLDQILSKKIS
jgi:serine/threonine protein phosphatase PrpC